MQRCLAAGLALVGGLAIAAPAEQAPAEPPEAVADELSFANLGQFRLTHFDLDLTADFDARRLQGSVVLYVARLDPAAAQLVLDARDIVVGDVTQLSTDIMGSTEPAKAEWVNRPFHLGRRDPIRGTPLVIDLPPSAAAAETVKIEYETSPAAPGLVWLTAPQTAGRKSPFLYTQPVPIGARSWIPLQDSPQVRVTYRAVIHAPPGLIAVMGAEGSPKLKHGADTLFVNPTTIPACQVALAIGDLGFKSTGPRSGVYAERPTLAAAAREFADVEAMLKAGEAAFGAYRWGRFDLLVLPPSFPGVTLPVPRLPFISATLIAGDKSLVREIAPALAAAWAGDLVGPAAWRDGWLGVGFSAFRAQQLQAAEWGAQRGRMSDDLDILALRDAMAGMPASAQILAADLDARDPATALLVPTEKGRLFLAFLGARFGAARFDEFLRGYADHFAFQSITTERFLEYLQQNLLDRFPGTVSRGEALGWIMDPGLPPEALRTAYGAIDGVAAVRTAWLEGAAPPAAGSPGIRDWGTPEWRYFLGGIPPATSAARLGELDRAQGFTKSDNAEIESTWIAAAIRSGYQPGERRLESYLQSTGRRDLVMPLYAELLKSPAGLVVARRIYPLARRGYDATLTATLDALVLPLPKTVH
jgi:aminopeptidase N